LHRKGTFQNTCYNDGNGLSVLGVKYLFLFLPVLTTSTGFKSKLVLAALSSIFEQCKQDIELTWRSVLFCQTTKGQTNKHWFTTKVMPVPLTSPTGTVRYP